MSATSEPIAAPVRSATKSAVSSGITSSTSTRSMSSSAYWPRPYLRAALATISMITTLSSAEKNRYPGSTSQAVAWIWRTASSRVSAL